LQRPEKYWFRAEEIYGGCDGRKRDKSVKLKVVVMVVFMVKAEERESERALRGHVACGSKGQTTGVLGYVHVCKDMVGILYKLIPLFSNYLFFFLQSPAATDAKEAAQGTCPPT
jgi:hypothetical protein